MAVFDFEKFNAQVYTAATEIVDQQVELFNTASAGALVLSPSANNVGDFSMKASFKGIAGLVRRRDVNNGTGAVAATRLSQLKDVSVKVASGTKPVDFERAQLNWIKQNPALAASTIGTQLAAAMMQDQLNTAVRGLSAAIGAQSALVHDISAATDKDKATFAALTAAAGKFGDRSMDVIAWIMHSKPMTDLYLHAISNAERLFQYGTVSVMRDPFGRVFVVTDSPALVATSKYTTLGLVEQAAMVEPNNDFDAVMVDSTGKENIQSTYQAEWSYNLGLLGYAWDVTKGGSAPSDIAIGTGGNWTKISTSVKDTAGVALVSM